MQNKRIIGMISSRAMGVRKEEKIKIIFHFIRISLLFVNSSIGICSVWMSCVEGLVSMLKQSKMDCNHIELSLVASSLLKSYTEQNLSWKIKICSRYFCSVRSIMEELGNSYKMRVTSKRQLK